jgi:hypothetical protein
MSIHSSACTLNSPAVELYGDPALLIEDDEFITDIPEDIGKMYRLNC